LELVKKLRIVSQKKGVILGEIDFYLEKLKELRGVESKMKKK